MNQLRFRTGERMLNIGKLRKGGENYYLNSVARGVEDYYLGSGEAPGYWLASGADDLGLEREVGDFELRNVLNGRHPTTGNPLVPERRGERVPGFDLTFRAPKSVSLLHALGPKEASNEVAAAHNAAVHAALDYLERHASGARRGKGGKDRIASTGFIAAAFRHRTSRAADPLLHTHVLVANLLQGEDGKWGALDARHLYLQAKTAGYLYQAHLRAELTRRLGVEWTPVRNGTADIAGIPRQVIDSFSSRRKEIEERVATTGATSGKGIQVAALVTRRPKDRLAVPQDLIPGWRAKAHSAGLTEETLEATLGKTNFRDPGPEEIAATEDDLADPTGLTAQASTFSQRDAIQGFCSRLQAGARVTDIEAMAASFLSSDKVVPLGPSNHSLTSADTIRVSDGRVVSVPSDGSLFSTPDMLSVEQSVIEASIERANERAGIADSGALAASLSKRPSLFPDQQTMVRRLATSGLGVEVVVGKAGAGKTFALDAAREAWETSGYLVIGCSLSARAARELQTGSGIPSCTLARLLVDLDDPRFGGLHARTVLVVDEAGMVGTRDLERVLTEARGAGAKVVLVGDDRQLPEISAGGSFRGIKERLPAIELTEVRRQPLGWERAALQLIRDGRAKDAIAAYTGKDRIVTGPNAEETRHHMVADWWATQNDGEPGIMLAARRSDVADLNRRARALMIAAGKLGESSLQVAGTEFAPGDRVMALCNNRGLGVVNGTRGVVEQIDATRGDLRMCCDDGSSVRLPASYLASGHLTHAYAITGHKAQGMTTERGLVLGDETLYREWAYVAMSRGRSNNRLYVVAGEDLDRDDLGGQVSKVADPLTEVTRALARSRAKELALDAHESVGREGEREADRHVGRDRFTPREIEIPERALEL
jgi:Ti-type conjugative transfer relaxase TraA